MLPPLLPFLLFSTHLLLYHLFKEAFTIRFQIGFGVKASKDVQQGSDQAGPSGLVVCSQSGSVVAMKIFIKENQVTPMGIVLELSRSAIEPKRLTVVTSFSRHILTRLFISNG